MSHHDEVFWFSLLAISPIIAIFIYNLIREAIESIPPDEEEKSA